MTVKELMAILKEAPEDMPVYVMTQNEGIFAFSEACEGETGIVELGPKPDDLYNKDVADDNQEFEVQMKVFAVLPHGLSDQVDHEPNHIHN